MNLLGSVITFATRFRSWAKPLFAQVWVVAAPCCAGTIERSLGMDDRYGEMDEAGKTVSPLSAGPCCRFHDGLDRHYRDLLDQPIPALGNKSPRAAVKTAKGRAKVVDWLKTLENHTAKFAGSNDEMATHNFRWLWTELGVNELRR
jgi:hypothetical protein